MTGYLLDTCAISELVKAKPDPGLAEWISTTPEAMLFLSVLTIGEIRRGVEKLPDGDRRLRLVAWLENDLAARFSGRLLDVDSAAAETWGRMTARLESTGKAVHAVDCLIAATAIARGMTVVTRNTGDFQDTQAELLNPWRNVI